MKKFTAVLILLAFFFNTAVASPAGQGGGSGSETDDSNISIIVTVALIVGVSALFVMDILSENSEDSQDALSGIVEEAEAPEETGIDWESILDETGDEQIPVVSLAVFNVENGKDLTHYFAALLEQGEQLFYSIHGMPVALGSMPSSEAAATGFSFMDCNWFVTGDNTGIKLFAQNQNDPVWQFNSTHADSAMIRAAAASFRAFAQGETE